MLDLNHTIGCENRLKKLILEAGGGKLREKEKLLAEGERCLFVGAIFAPRA
jgi:hypothetical protein